MSYGTTRAGAILAGGFQKVFENLALVDIFRICSTTKIQRFSRGFSRMAMNFREHTYEFQGVVDFSSSVSSAVLISVQLVGSHLRSVGQR